MLTYTKLFTKKKKSKKLFIQIKRDGEVEDWLYLHKFKIEGHSFQSIHYDPKNEII